MIADGVRSAPREQRRPHRIDDHARSAGSTAPVSSRRTRAGRSGWSSPWAQASSRRQGRSSSGARRRARRGPLRPGNGRCRSKNRRSPRCRVDKPERLGEDERNSLVGRQRPDQVGEGDAFGESGGPHGVGEFGGGLPVREIHHAGAGPTARTWSATVRRAMDSRNPRGYHPSNRCTLPGPGGRFPCEVVGRPDVTDAPRSARRHVGRRGRTVPWRTGSRAARQVPTPRCRSRSAGASSPPRERDRY